MDLLLKPLDFLKGLDRVVQKILYVEELVPQHQGHVGLQQYGLGLNLLLVQNVHNLSNICDVADPDARHLIFFAVLSKLDCHAALDDLILFLGD